MNYFVQTIAKPKQQIIDFYVYFYKKHLNQNMVYGRNTKSIQMAYNNLCFVWAVKSVWDILYKLILLDTVYERHTFRQ
jgi:hypothetical protein